MLMCLNGHLRILELFTGVEFDIRGVLEQWQDWAQKSFIPNTNCKLQHVAFEVIHLKSNALHHPPLPCLHALLEGFVQDRSELLRHGHFNGFYVRKTCSFHDSLSLGNRKKSQGARSGEYGGCSSTAMLFLTKNSLMLNALCARALLWWSSHDFFSYICRLFLHWPHQTSLDIPVNVLVDGLALWQEFCVQNVPHIKESNQHHLDFILGQKWLSTSCHSSCPTHLQSF